MMEKCGKLLKHFQVNVGLEVNILYYIIKYIIIT